MEPGLADNFVAFDWPQQEMEEVKWGAASARLEGLLLVPSYSSSVSKSQLCGINNSTCFSILLINMFPGGI